MAFNQIDGYENKTEENELVSADYMREMGLDLLIFNFKPTYGICDLVLQIKNQNTFSGYVYDQFCSKEYIFKHPPELSRVEFIRIWKSCLLIRSQELYSRFKGKTPANDRFLMKPESVPVPLAHLLKALGRCRCPTTGVIADVIPPPLNSGSLPKWAVHDKSILTRWRNFMNDIDWYYNHYEVNSTYPFRSSLRCQSFPHIDDCDGKSIGLTAIKVEDDIKRIRAVSNTSNGIDMLIRMCNDELFLHPVRSFEDMVVQFSHEFDADVLREKYFAQYYGTSPSWDKLRFRLNDYFKSLTTPRT